MRLFILANIFIQQQQTSQMIAYPCAKVNLGLNVVSKRADGYHDIETVFYPIPLCDKLEISISENQTPTPHPCKLVVGGNAIDCCNEDNLVVKAYRLLADEHQLANIEIRLQKNIPSQAGLGGGSSDAAYMLRMINSLCALGIDNGSLERRAAQLGADCPFFITAEPAYATGIGDILSPVAIKEKLTGCFMIIVKPDVSISTKAAYSMIKPAHPDINCRDAVMLPLETWRHNLSNDFEQAAFSLHPELSDIKRKLYDMGAEYAQMSGSGSAFFGIFKTKPQKADNLFPNYYTTVLDL